MRLFSFWDRWLLGLAALIVLFGLGIALLSPTPLFDMVNNQVNSVFWGPNRVPPESQHFIAWVYGVLGATMAGWGVFLVFLVIYPFRAREAWAWNCIVMGLAVWYVVDTAISISSGVYFNAVFNTFIMAAAFIPLLFTRGDFRV